jgi:hypothetical protein
LANDGKFFLWPKIKNMRENIIEQAAFDVDTLDNNSQSATTMTGISGAGATPDCFWKNRHR